MTTFLMIARVLYDKGYLQFVDAARQIGKEYESSFVLIGDTDLANPNHVPVEIIENHVNEGIIEYLGYKSDIHTYIKKADCIVLPSFHEGLSRVLMEALAMSKPIITTDIPGCRETVDDCINGFLCKPQDSQSLIQSCLKFINLTKEEQIKMGEASRKKAEKRFDVKKVIEVYKAITDSFII